MIHTKKIILTVIILASLSVVAAVICSFIFAPERVTKSYLSSLASDYYENHFYDKLVESNAGRSDADFESMMAKNSEKRFINVTLRQLILYDQAATAERANYVLKYCDEELTKVIIYPDPPYDRTSYHTEFTYSCAF